MTYILEAYDDALRTIVSKGVRKRNRTGVDTLAIFGMQCRYDISESFPLLTRRKTWPKAIFAELLWMLSGSTNNRDLQALGSNIWTPWSNPEFEKEHGYVEGSLGPVYGFQLRHFDGEYGDGSANSDYGSNGFDQIQYMLDLLNEDKDSRRIMFSLWNPKQIKNMRLAPCHYSFQLFVHEDRLSGMLTQRSADFPIGVPANIQFYSALIYMFAQQAGLKPHEFIHTTGDSHVYVNQIEAVEVYLSRYAGRSPRLNLNKADSIFSYKMEDFEIADYYPLSAIKIPVAV